MAAWAHGPGAAALAALAVAGVALVLALAALAVTSGTARFVPAPAFRDKAPDADGAWRGRRAVRRIAFGSDTAFDPRHQAIWEQGVVAAEPDAWVWLGGFAPIDCAAPANEAGAAGCAGGGIGPAVLQQLQDAGYRSFLDFMCPGLEIVPPPGLDPEICERPILGVYNRNDVAGDARSPNRWSAGKTAAKTQFLDAMGSTSVLRRSSARGMEAKTTFNAGKEKIAVYLLDEIFYRDWSACRTRRGYCQAVLGREGSSAADVAWCEQFLEGCCTKDDELYFGWCRTAKPSFRSTAAFREACEPWRVEYGAHNWKIEVGGEGLVLPEQEEDGGRVAESADDSPFCEILGPNQRQWLRRELEEQPAALTIVASPSPLFDGAVDGPCFPGEAGSPTCPCPLNDDGLDCLKPAQLNLMNLLADAPGCVVVITGGPSSNITVVPPAEKGVPLSAADLSYRTDKLRRALFQVAASGLTLSTAPSGANFGMVEADFAADLVTLQIRSENSTVVRESAVKLSTCSALPPGDE